MQFYVYLIFVREFTYRMLDTLFICEKIEKVVASWSFISVRLCSIKSARSAGSRDSVSKTSMEMEMMFYVFIIIFVPLISGQTEVRNRPILK